MRCYALIVAAGSGSRMGASVPKQLLALCGRPLLAWTVAAFQQASCIDGIVIATAEQMRDPIRQLLDEQGLSDGVSLCKGGQTRAQSVAAGLQALPAEAELVAIHDAARALVTPTLIERVVQVAAAAAPDGAALPVLPVNDTVKLAEKSSGCVATTVDRQPLRLAQTPQVFSVPLIRSAHQRLSRNDAVTATDDAQAAELAGARVQLVEGDPTNIKITVPDDLVVAEALLRARAMNEQVRIRTGIGYDVHRLEPGEAVILGGERIAFDKSLVGHSDADVLCHAAGDALLGAAALGDLGEHFPPGDPQYKDISSLELLRQISQRVTDAGFRIGNLDCTVICELPRVAPHAAQMRANLAKALGVATEQVSIKATTTEGLGLTGRGEGIAAQATALIEGTERNLRCLKKQD